MALKGKIRAQREREGKSISEIARRTSLSRNTIKKWLRAPADAQPKYRRQGVASKLTPFVETITQALKTDAPRAQAVQRGRDVGAGAAAPDAHARAVRWLRGESGEGVE